MTEAYHRPDSLQNCSQRGLECFEEKLAEEFAEKQDRSEGSADGRKSTGSPLCGEHWWLRSAVATTELKRRSFVSFESVAG